MHRLADLGAHRNDEIGLRHGIGADRRGIGKGAVFQAFEEGAAAGRLDDRTGQRTRQRRHAIMRARDEGALPQQQDGLLRGGDERHGVRHRAGAGALRDEAIILRRQRRRQVELRLHHAHGIFDIDGPRRAAERTAEGFVHDLVGLLREFYDTDIFHRALEIARLRRVLETAAADALVEETLALAHDEDGGGVLLRGADRGRREIGDAWALIADDDPGPARHPPHRIGHEGARLLVVRRDDPPAPRFGGDEHGDEAGDRVCRKASNQVSTVNYATADGTAVAPGDYTPTNGTCVFTNGVTSQTFTVRVIAGNTVQPDKTVLLQLSSPSGGSYLAPPSAAVLIIHDTSGSLVVPAGSAFAPNGDPNHNGLIDTNETVTLLFAFRAAGGNNVTNLYATLLAANGVTSPSPATPVSYGQLNVGGPSAYRAFSFTAVGTNGQQIAATFLLTNGTTGLGTALFTYTLGSWTTVFTNPNPIIINAAAAASPYPSTITVSNLGGVLLKTVITLTNMTHTAPAAINALLVSPNQNDTLFMSHAGGGEFGGAINGVTLTFEDATQTNSLPFNGQITNGVYNSTQYGGAPVFP